MHARAEQSFCLKTGAVPCVCGAGEPLLPFVKVEAVPLFRGRGTSGGGSLQVTLS